VRDSSSSPSFSFSTSSCLIPPRLVSSRVHNECRASQLYRVCGRASRFPRTTSLRSPSPEPFASLFSDSEPADLQARVTGRKGEGLAVPLSPRLSLFLSLSLSLSLSVCLFFSFLPLTSRDNRAFGLSDNFALSGCTSERSNQFQRTVSHEFTQSESHSL
jgi:hypothetical protein